MTTVYVVSEDRDYIVLAGKDSPAEITEYGTPEDAGDAIKQGHHGEYGTRYVLKITREVVAEYSRSWTLVRKAPETRKAEGS